MPRCLKNFTLPCLAIFLLVPFSVLGAEVEGLYDATITLTSRDDEAELQQAFSTAMREVLVKVSGSRDALLPNQIRRAINNPRSYAETWGYQGIQGEEGDDEITVLEVSFYESEILALLDDNELPYWSPIRPTTLLWLVIQEEAGEREVISSTGETSPELMTLVEAEAQLKGLPLLFPLMDLEDQQSLGADKLWELDEETIIAASARYQSESILAMRIFRSLSGELIAESVYFFRDRPFYLESFDEELGTLLDNAISLAARELSASYAIRISGGTGSTIINLTVEGIASASAYAALLDYVSGLTDVNAYQILSVSPEGLLMELSTGGQLRQLLESIALGVNLEPTAELTRDINGVHMHYRWIE